MCFGEHSLVVHDYDFLVHLLGYDPCDETKKNRTVSAAVSWTHPQTGQVYMLVIIQTVHVPQLQHHLLCL